MKGEYPERVGQPECQVTPITNSSIIQKHDSVIKVLLVAMIFQKRDLVIEVLYFCRWFCDWQCYIWSLIEWVVFFLWDDFKKLLTLFIHFQ
jgi:hypothetical protein